MVTIADLQAAKLLVEHGIVDSQIMQSTLIELTQRRTQATPLLDLLRSRNVIDSAIQQQTLSYLERQQSLRQEAVYTELLASRNILTPQQIQQAQAHLTPPQRLGQLLVTQQLLTHGQDEFLRSEAQQKIQSVGQKYLAQFVQSNFTTLLSLPQATDNKPAFDSGAMTLIHNPPKFNKPTQQPNEQQLTPINPPGAPETPPEARPEPKPVAVAEPVAQVPGEMLAFDPASLGEPVDAEPPLIKDYEVVRKLGEGGNGIVYLAKKSNGEFVALKVVRQDGDPDAIRRFRREILATSLIDHANIIQIFDAGQSERNSYMAMEVLDGKELRDVITTESRLAPHRVLNITKQILRALTAIHQAHIVHRDLKPENFMILSKADDDFVKVMDFGIARIQDESDVFADQVFTTVQGQISGSPKYIAPETISDPDFDSRVDLYSLGIIFIEMLTGSLPYKAKSTPQWLQQHLYYDPTPIADLAPDLELPASFQKFAETLLDKDPDNRFQTAREALSYISGKLEPDLKGWQPAQTADDQTNDDPEGGTSLHGNTTIPPVKQEKRGCLGFLFRKKKP